MARSRTTSQTPEDVGWPQTSKPGGPSTAKRSAEVRTTTDAASPGKSTYVAPTIPDPNITHGRLKVLQNTAGQYFLFDTRAAPGRGVILTIDPKSFKAKDDVSPKVQALKAAEAEAKRLAADYPDD